MYYFPGGFHKYILIYAVCYLVSDFRRSVKLSRPSLSKKETFKTSSAFDISVVVSEAKIWGHKTTGEINKRTCFILPMVPFIIIGVVNWKLMTELRTVIRCIRWFRVCTIAKSITEIHNRLYFLSCFDCLVFAANSQTLKQGNGVDIKYGMCNDKTKKQPKQQTHST